MTRIYLALGSNLGDREAHLRHAIEALNVPDLLITRISPVYETEPWGFADQGWFLNLVLEAETTLLPVDLLAHCLAVEHSQRRERVIPNGPRTLDIDVLFYGDSVIQTTELEVPHPRYAERRFVLQPLADLNPKLRDPATHLSVEQMLAALRDQALRRTAIVIAAAPSS